MTSDKIFSEIDCHIDDILKRQNIKSHQLHIIPPIIGFLIADKFGNTIMIFEYKLTKNSKFRPIKHYLIEGDENLLELDLISMYFSSFRSFAGQTNIKNLSHLEIQGSNIKTQINYINDFIIISFLNASVFLIPKIKSKIINYFSQILEKYEYELKNFNEKPSRKVIKIIEKQGNLFLRSINAQYIRFQRMNYERKHFELELIMEELAPLINEEIEEQLSNLPRDIIKNLQRELTTKIQDKLFEIDI